MQKFIDYLRRPSKNTDIKNYQNVSPEEIRLQQAIERVELRLKVLYEEEQKRKQNLPNICGGTDKVGILKSHPQGEGPFATQRTCKLMPMGKNLKKQAHLESKIRKEEKKTQKKFDKCIAYMEKRLIQYETMRKKRMRQNIVHEVIEKKSQPNEIDASAHSLNHNNIYYSDNDTFQEIKSNEDSSNEDESDEQIENPKQESQDDSKNLRTVQVYHMKNRKSSPVLGYDYEQMNRLRQPDNQSMDSEISSNEFTDDENSGKITTSDESNDETIFNASIQDQTMTAKEDHVTSYNKNSHYLYRQSQNRIPYETTMDNQSAEDESDDSKYSLDLSTMNESISAEIGNGTAVGGKIPNKDFDEKRSDSEKCKENYDIHHMQYVPGILLYNNSPYNSNIDTKYLKKKSNKRLGVKFSVIPLTVTEGYSDKTSSSDKTATRIREKPFIGGRQFTSGNDEDSSLLVDDKNVTKTTINGSTQRQSESLEINQTTPDHQPYQISHESQPYPTTPQTQPYQITPEKQPHSTTPEAQPYQTTPALQPNEIMPEVQPHSTTPDAQSYQRPSEARPYQITPGAQPYRVISKAQPHQISPRAQSRQISRSGQQYQVPFSSNPHQVPLGDQQQKLSESLRSYQIPPGVHPHQITQGPCICGAPLCPMRGIPGAGNNIPVSPGVTVPSGGQWRTSQAPVIDELGIRHTVDDAVRTSASARGTIGGTGAPNAAIAGVPIRGTVTAGGAPAMSGASTRKTIVDTGGAAAVVAGVPTRNTIADASAPTAAESPGVTALNDGQFRTSQAPVIDELSVRRTKDGARKTSAAARGTIGGTGAPAAAIAGVPIRGTVIAGGVPASAMSGVSTRKTVVAAGGVPASAMSGVSTRKTVIATGGAAAAAVSPRVTAPSGGQWRISHAPVIDGLGIRRTVGGAVRTSATARGTIGGAGAPAAAITSAPIRGTVTAAGVPASAESGVPTRKTVAAAGAPDAIVAGVPARSTVAGNGAPTAAGAPDIASVSAVHGAPPVADAPATPRAPTVAPIINGAPAIAGAPTLAGVPAIAGAPEVAGAPTADTPAVVGAPTVTGAPSVAGPTAIAGVPAIADAPTIASTPVVAGAPAFAGVPAVVGPPDVPSAPTIAEAPAVAGAPNVAGASATGGIPVVTGTSVVASDPTAARASTVDDRPTAVGTPVVAGVPAVAGVPTVAATPAISDVPSAGAAPAVVGIPTVSGIPVVSGAPAVTPTDVGAPAAAIAPATVTAPAATDVKDPTAVSASVEVPPTVSSDDTSSSASDSSLSGTSSSSETSETGTTDTTATSETSVTSTDVPDTVITITAKEIAPLTSSDENEEDKRKDHVKAKEPDQTVGKKIKKRPKTVVTERKVCPLEIAISTTRMRILNPEMVREVMVGKKKGKEETCLDRFQERFKWISDLDLNF